MALFKALAGKRMLSALFLLMAGVLAGCGQENKTMRELSQDARAFAQSRELDRRQLAFLRVTDQTYRDAPAVLRDAAFRIVAGEVPDAESLQALGEEIDRPYPRKDRIDANLLVTAFEQPNFEALDALLAAGADPTRPLEPEATNRYRMWDFTTVFMFHKGTWLEEERRWSFTNANKALELYLKYGGDPNHDGWLHTGPLLKDSLYPLNETGFKMLYEAGADPWAPSDNDADSYTKPIVYSLSLGIGDIHLISYLIEKGEFSGNNSELYSEMINNILRSYRSIINNEGVDQYLIELSAVIRGISRQSGVRLQGDPLFDAIMDGREP